MGTRVTMGRVRSIVTEQCFGGGNSIALYRKQSQALTDNSVRRINSALTRTTRTTISTRRISSPSTSSSATKMSTIKTPIKIQKIISAVRRRVMTTIVATTVKTTTTTKITKTTRARSTNV